MLFLTLLLVAEVTQSRVNDSLSRAHDRCLEAAMTSRDYDAAFDRCVEVHLKARDDALNREYAKVMKRSSASQREALRMSERQWIKDRDQGCRAEAEAVVSTARVYMFQVCSSRYTRKRTEWLRTQ